MITSGATADHRNSQNITPEWFNDDHPQAKRGFVADQVSTLRRAEGCLSNTLGLHRTVLATLTHTP